MCTKSGFVGMRVFSNLYIVASGLLE